MNYRHIYHAGNFADVLKHAVLALVIEHLKLKPTPFRVIDTHAGTGRYDLTSEAAQKTGEWRLGIGRLLDAPLPTETAHILAPYIDSVHALNGDGQMLCYPGSPRIARMLMRRDDRLIVNELHASDRAALEQEFRSDTQTKVLGLDGWIALKALLPPMERRGAVLIDPPFEQPDEFARLVEGFRDAARRFATGIIVAWYPVKDAGPVAAFRRELAKLGLPKLLSVELMVALPAEIPGLPGMGLAILNPPHTLLSKLEIVLPVLVERLAQSNNACFSMHNIYLD